MLRAILEICLPGACGRCGRWLAGGAVLCDGCDAALPRLAPGGCRSCQATDRGLDPTGRCDVCPDDDGLAACVAAAPFADEIAEWMRRFKFPPRGFAGFEPTPSALIRQLVREAALRAPGPAPDAVVPIPYRPRRVRQRGFDPAALLAREVARAVDARRDPRLLARVRDTATQTGLDRAARRRNLAGAFRLRRPLPGPVIWLVDDVVTTGSTLLEAARTLRRAGARRVVGVVAARTPRADADCPPGSEGL